MAKTISAATEAAGASDVTKEEMIRKLVAHSVKTALAESKPYWLGELFEKGFAGFSIGPLSVRYYALCILAGIVVGLWITARRLRARGGRAGQVADIAGWAVPFGIVGGRLYHVITDHQLYFGPGGAGWVAALRIWDGGLGIWGAVVLGALGGSAFSLMWDPYINSVGASGAVMGVIGATLMFMVDGARKVPFSVLKEHAAVLVSFAIFSQNNEVTAAKASGRLRSMRGSSKRRPWASSGRIFSVSSRCAARSSCAARCRARAARS